MFKNINIYKVIIAILIFFIPLYPKFPLSSVKGTYVAIRLDDIIIAFFILIWALLQLKNKLPVLKLKITKLFIVYFLAIIASTVNAILIYQTDPTNILLLHMLRRFEYISVFFIAISSIKSLKDINLIYIALLFSTLFISIYGYGQKYFNFPVISTMNSEFSKGQLLEMNIWTRISSTFAGHYDLAAFLSLVLIIIGCVAIITKNIPVKIFSILVWLISFPILTFTASRISIFAFWGGMCLTLFLLKKYLWIVPVSLLVVFSMFSSNDLNQRLMATVPAIKNQLFQKPTPTLQPTPIPPIIAVPTLNKRLPTPTPAPYVTPVPTIIRHGPLDPQIPIDEDVGVARSSEIRFNAEWPRAITAYKKNYILGTGLGSITLATDNDYLRLLGESGLLGFISFMVIILFFVIKTVPVIFRKEQSLQKSLNIIFLGCLITMLANSIFIDVFEASKVAYIFWIIMGIYHQTLNSKK